MATYTKLPLSASVNGKHILISATASGSATPIHTAVAGTGSLDEIYLYSYNDATSSLQLNILWGGTVEPNDVMRVTVLPKSGRTLVVDGKLLQNNLIVSAYAGVGSLVTVDGFVNRIV
jgi:hypothetical protein